MKRRSGVLLTLSLLLLFGCSKSPEEKMAEIYADGLAAVESYRFDEAKKIYDRASDVDMSDPAPLYGQGLIFQQEFMSYDALAAYLQILESLESYRPAIIGACEVFAQLGHHAEGLPIARDYLKNHPDDLEITLAAANLAAGSGNKAYAVRMMEQAVALGFDSTAGVLWQAVYRVEKTDRDSLTGAVAELLSGTNLTEVQLLAAADYYQAVEHTDSAMICAWGAFERSDKKLFDVHRLMERAFACSDPYRARQALEFVPEDAGLPRVALEVKYLWQFGGNETAANRGSDFLGKYANELSSLLFEVHLAVQAADQPGAEQAANLALATLEARSYPEMVDNIARLDQARAIIPRALSTTVLVEIDKLPRRYFQKIDIAAAYLKSLFDTGQPERFRDLLKQLESSHTRQADWLCAIGRVFYSPGLTGEQSKALEYFLKARAADSLYMPAVIDIVDYHVRRKEFDKALTAIDDAGYLLASSPLLQVQRASILVRLGRTTEAVDQFTDAMTSRKHDLDRYREIWTLLLRSGDTEAVGKFLTTLTTFNESNPDGLALAARLANESENYAQALDLADRAAAIDPGLLSAPVEKAWSMFKLDRKSEAFEQFVANAVIDFEDYRNNYYYSRALATEKRELRRAANLARKAIQMSQGLEWAAENLSYVYYQMDRPDLSYGEAKKAISAFQESPDLWFRLGIAMKKREMSGYKDALQKAIDFGLFGERLVEAKQQLES
jgi:predicted Zn-dependent protease